MERTMMEKTHRIACEIFTLAKTPVKHESVYDIMRIGIGYLLRWCSEKNCNVLYLKNLFINELYCNELSILIEEKTKNREMTMGEKFLCCSLELCRERPEYRESVHDCIVILEHLWLQGMDNEFEQKFDGLLARNIVRNEVFVPFTKRPTATIHISLKNNPV